jgi:hypothetical protein
VSHALTSITDIFAIGPVVAVWALFFGAGVAPRFISLARFIFFTLFSCPELLTVGAR